MKNTRLTHTNSLTHILTSFGSTGISSMMRRRSITVDLSMPHKSFNQGVQCKIHRRTRTIQLTLVRTVTLQAFIYT